MWKYCGAAFFFLIGALEIILALNGRMRAEIMKTYPIKSTRATPLFLLLAGLSALAIAVGILFYNRFL
ncbi:MAG TPA: hypothetical protein VGJ66_00460 [Pyrinomonadaceae bacterium]|jgi:hypothetical protein